MTADTTIRLLDLEGPLLVRHEGARRLEQLEELERLQRGLTPRQREVIARRYGLDGEPAQPVSELARELGISRTRVHQIVLNAIYRMRQRAGLYRRARG